MGVKGDAQDLLSAEQRALIPGLRRGLLALKERLRNVGEMKAATKPKKSTVTEEPVVESGTTAPAVPVEAIEATPPPEDLVEVRTPKFILISDGAPGAYNPSAVYWRTRAGYTVTFRPRTPEDGDAAVIVEADPPLATVEKVDDGESYDQWRQRLYSGGGTGRQAPDAKKTGEGAGRYVPSRRPTWTERQRGFAGWGGR